MSKPSNIDSQRIISLLDEINKTRSIIMANHC